MRLGLTKSNFQNAISGNTRLRRLVPFHQTYYELSYPGIKKIQIRSDRGSARHLKLVNTLHMHAQI